MNPSTPTDLIPTSNAAHGATSYVKPDETLSSGDYWLARDSLPKEISESIATPNLLSRPTEVGVVSSLGQTPTDHVSNVKDLHTSVLQSDAPATRPKHDESAQTARQVRVRERWEGYVQDVSEGYFTARVTPAGQALPALLVDLSFEALDPGDLELLQPGAHLYLNVGYVPLSPSTRLPYKVVRLSRLAAWQAGDIDRFVERGREMRSALELDEPN